MRGDRYDRDEHGEPRKRASGGGNAGPLLIGCGCVAAVLLTAIAGGGVWYFAVRETTADVIAQYRPQFVEQRAKLKRVAAQLPPVGSVREDTLPATLNPKPAYNVRTKTFNTAFLMAVHCDDPDRELRPSDDLNLAFHEDEFRTHLLWTGDKSPMAPEGRRSSSGDLAQRFERSLRMPYLVVFRPVRFVPPRVVNDRNFIGGELDVEVFLVDYQAEKVIGSFRRSFTPVERVRAEAKDQKELGDRAEAMVRSEAWGKARADIVATLVRGTGGTFVTDLY